MSNNVDVHIWLKNLAKECVVMEDWTQPAGKGPALPFNTFTEASRGTEEMLQYDFFCLW